MARLECDLVLTLVFGFLSKGLTLGKLDACVGVSERVCQRHPRADDHTDCDLASVVFVYIVYIFFVKSEDNN